MTNITLFIGRIPTDTSVRELRAFVDGGVSWSLRLRSGLRYKIIRAEILRNIDEKSMQIEFHGLVTIRPPAIADRIIEKLNLKELKGKVVTVRRYHERSDHNDRRRYQSNDMPLPLRNRRLRERRTQVSIDFDRERSKLLSRGLERSD